MKTTIKLIISVLVSFISVSAFNKNLTTLSKPASLQPNPETVKDPVTITILYDNYVHEKGTQSDWGFSCLIENTSKTILFDTGTDPAILNKNVKILNKELGQIDAIVISHNHGDHTGGLFDVLKRLDKVEVYLPHSTPGPNMNKVEKAGAVLFYERDLIQICENCYLTGELGDNIKEQSLIIDTEKGLVLVTGCSHPGIVNIVKRAKELLDKEVYMVLGGFHLMRYSTEMTNEIIAKLRTMGVKKCGPTHCSGDETIQIFREAFGNNFIQLGTGQVIEISP